MSAFCRMAGLRVKLLLVVVLVLVLVQTVQGWEAINETELIRLYESGAWSEAVNVAESDDKDYDNYEEGVPGKIILETETEGEVGSLDPFAEFGIEVDGVDSGPRILAKEDDYEEEVLGKTILEAETQGEVDSFDPFAENEFEVDEVDPGPRIWPDSKESEFEVDEVDPGPRIWSDGKESEFEVDEVDPGSRIWSDGKESEFEVDEVNSGPGIWPDGKESEFEVDGVDPGPRIWPDGKESEFEVDEVAVPPRRWIGKITPITANLLLVCNDAGFEITLLTGKLSDVKVLGPKKFVSFEDAEEPCTFDVKPLEKILNVPFSGCNVKRHDNGYSLQLLHVDSLDRLHVSTLFCKETPKWDPHMYPRGGRPHTCVVPAAPHSEPSPPKKAHNCGVNMAERLTCGYEGISASECEKIGCCFGSTSSSCYYPLDECTVDQHFVFAIRHDAASIPVNPKKLVIPGHADCKPVILNDKVAIFKFKVTECGTRVYHVGEVKIYLAEVQTIVQVLNLKFGLITRSNPLRFLIECRYSKLGAAQPSLATVGYMVKTPPSHLPSAVVSNGLYGVQLRIATDQTYHKFYPTYHQPLKLLLGKPVYLELRLKSPKPDAVILVNYCLAYPRSAKNALVLIYEGCANPHDPNVSILQISGAHKTRNRRRFSVDAFQFMEQKTNQYLDEEIYFMCSTEVCRPTEKKCEERCFDGKMS